MITYYLYVFQRTIFTFSFGLLITAILGIFFPAIPFWYLDEIQVNYQTIPLIIRGFVPWITFFGTLSITLDVALKDFKRRHYL